MLSAQVRDLEGFLRLVVDGDRSEVVHAIKAVREAKGCGLKEAFDVVRRVAPPALPAPVVEPSPEANVYEGRPSPTRSRHYVGS